MTMKIFDIHSSVMENYADYIQSFVNISDDEIREHVDNELKEGKLWPQPLLQFNPAYKLAGSADSFQDPPLNRELKTVLKNYKLYQHQIDVENLTQKDLEQLKAFQVVLEHLDRDRPLVPVYDRFVLAGEDFSEDFISGYRLNECGADYVIRASDMSMEPVVPEGALVYLKQESELKAVNGKLAVFADPQGYPVIRKVVL